MAALAVCCTDGGVIKGRWQPAAGLMAGGALHLKMVRRTVVDMTPLAVHCACNCMVEGGWQPTGRRMTGRAVPRIMYSRPVL